MRQRVPFGMALAEYVQKWYRIYSTSLATYLQDTFQHVERSGTKKSLLPLEMP